MEPERTPFRLHESGKPYPEIYEQTLNALEDFKVALITKPNGAHKARLSLRAGLSTHTMQ